MRCEQVMKNPVAYVMPDETARRAAFIMREANIGFLPVCDGDLGVVGTLTDRDLATRVCAEGADANLVRVGDVMSNDAITCRADDDLTHAEQLMARHQKQRIVVTDEIGRLIGVISLSDVVERDSNKHAAHTMRKIVSRQTGV
jgi:CBS domain-containing protein